MLVDLPEKIRHSYIKLKNDNWQELCAKIDCEQFPKNYETIIFEGNITYYLPLRTIYIPNRKVWLTGNRTNRYSEIEKSKRIRVVSYYKDFIRPRPYHPFPRVYYRFHNIYEIFEGSFPLHVELISSPIYMERTEKGRGNKTAPWIDTLYSDNFRSFKNLEAAKYLSLNEYFWIVKQDRAIEYENSSLGTDRKFQIVSKKPIFQGLHLYGYCYYGGCIFHTFGFEDEGNTKPVFRITNRHQPRYQVVKCKLPNPLLNCDNHDDYFDKFQKSLNALDFLFNKFQQYPS